ncbi:MAG: DUF1501 domain-containing protein [Planctomycetota bacterium]
MRSDDLSSRAAGRSVGDLLTRRQLVRDGSLGLGRLALASLLVDKAAAAVASADRRPHFAPRAKRVLHLFMAGAPSQLDLFDEKPLLRELEGKPIPAEFTRDARFAFIRKDASLLGPRFPFARHGQCGANLSSALPHLAEVVDHLAIVRSVHTDQFNHAPAQTFFATGSPFPGRPSMGSWLSYGLGSEADDLPAYVVLSSGGGASGGSALWSSGFLPTRHAGVPFLRRGDPIPNLGNPSGVDETLQRDTVAALAALNGVRLEALGDPEIAARTTAYELAFRMQARAPELTGFPGESPDTFDLYGVDDPKKASFARNCLVARRLLERGVRFVQLVHEVWDHHSDVEGGVRKACKETDQACAALVFDLHRRGLLDDTLVVWGGEFGRTPMVEAHAALKRSNGRDHHPQAFTVWLAGAGVRPGLQLGATDDFGFHAVEDPVHVHDLQATILHLMGFDHERLTFRHQGRDFRLTDVSGKVVTKLLA